MTEGDISELLRFFKALSDSNRVKIIGLLAKRSYTVEHLAALLGTSPSTVSHHLARLSAAGLVSARPESYYNVYSLEAGRLEEMTRRLLSQEAFPGAAASVDLSAYDRMVVANYSTPNGRLKTIPAQRKKLDAVLRHLVKSFEPGQRYTEKEVNDILSRFHPDTATLRRELIGGRLLAREPGGGKYWRMDDDEDAEEVSDGNTDNPKPDA